MVLIDFVTAREILDSRGIPTIEATVILNDGRRASASVPSGFSRSRYEAIDLRDADASRYNGLGVTHAVKNINETISPRLNKMNPIEQHNVDKVINELDQTPNKAHLGTNATLAVSLATARTASMVIERPLWSHINDLFIKTRAKNVNGEEAALLETQILPKLPIPIFNLINGGLHSHSGLKYQEFIAIPRVKQEPSEHIRWGVELRYEIERELQKKNLFFGIGDQGGVSVQLTDAREVLQILSDSVKHSGRKFGEDIAFGIDVAADFIDNFNPRKEVEEFQSLTSDFPIIYLEDPMPARDVQPWVHLRSMLHDKLGIVSDDLTATNPDRLRESIREKAIDLTVIKPNQIGTLTDALVTAKVAKHHTLGVVVSGRSGETNDTFITDLAVGIGATYLKAGSPVRGERVCKYNRLTEIVNESNWDIKKDGINLERKMDS